MDGISAVTARISEIRSLMNPAAVAAPTATRSSTTPVSTATLGTAPLGTAPLGTAPLSTAPHSTPTGTTAGSFADALAQAARLPATPATGLSVADLTSTYRNGRVPAGALSPIGHGDHRLAAPAAAAFTELEAAARRDGVTLGVTDSYRSYDAQVDVARRKGLYSQGGLAAQPGTSQHGWGLAVDLDLDATAQAWMRTHGARFGFVEDTPREPWHWAYRA